jgi:hypothetical protein
MTSDTILFTAIASCASAIVFLFGLEMKHHNKTREDLKESRNRLDTCETARQEMAVRLAVLEAPIREEAKRVADNIEKAAIAFADSVKALGEHKK